MISKNNKKLILSGILLIVSTICYVTYQIMLGVLFNDYYGINDYAINWANIIFATIGAVIVNSYCFIFNKTKANKIVYFLGFGELALFNAYFVITNIVEGYLDLYTFAEVFYLAVIVIMIVIKFKSNKGIAIAGTVMFGAYALSELILVIEELVLGSLATDFIWLVFDIYLVLELIAFFNIWLVESGNSLFDKKTIETIKTPLEDNLVSLKQLYDSGAITEQEYNEKKTEILNKL